MRKKGWVARDVDPPVVTLRCNFHTRLIVPAGKAPSGQRYDFQPGEVKDDVLQEDVKYLLSLVYQQSACCGSTPGGPIHYFEIV